MIWIFAIASAYCFWVAGRGKNDIVLFPAPRALRKKLYRRLGCTVTAGAYLILFSPISFNLWAFLAFLGLSYGVLSSYFDFWGVKGTLPSGEKFQDETTLTWAICGLFYGISAIPLYWLGVSWQMIALRTLALMILIPLVRKIPSVHIQEAGSGFFYLITMGILT